MYPNYIYASYSSGAIIGAINTVLTERRVKVLNKIPIKIEHFISALVKYTPSTAEESNKFRLFTEEVTGMTTIIEKKKLAASAEEGEGEKGKGKKGKK